MERKGERIHYGFIHNLLCSNLNVPFTNLKVNIACMYLTHLYKLKVGYNVCCLYCTGT